MNEKNEYYLQTILISISVGLMTLAFILVKTGRDLICFEPMTAATNAMASGWPELNALSPGESYIARFSILVS